MGFRVARRPRDHTHTLVRTELSSVGQRAGGSPWVLRGVTDLPKFIAIAPTVPSLRFQSLQRVLCVTWSQPISALIGLSWTTCKCCACGTGHSRPGCLPPLSPTAAPPARHRVLQASLVTSPTCRAQGRPPAPSLISPQSVLHLLGSQTFPRRLSSIHHQHPVQELVPAYPRVDS